MASLTLKNIPPRLLRSLRAAAESDRRNLTRKILYLLDMALRDRAKAARAQSHDVETQLAAWRKLAGTWQSDVDPTRS